METFSIAKIISQRAELPKKKIEHEFQQLGLEMQEWFPKEQWKRLWTIFYKKGFTERLIREALKVCRERNVKNIAYLIAIVNNKLK